MINVSSEFRALMEERTDFMAGAEITLADGTVLSAGGEELVLSGNTLTDGAGASGLPLGEAVCRTIRLELMNDDGQLDGYDFYGAGIRLWLDFALTDTTERIELGTFTVTQPETWGETVAITAGDAMYKADRAYAPACIFPATLGTMFRDICDTCAIPYSTAEFANDGFLVQEAPSGDYTCRQVLGFIAMLAGGNARVNRSGSMEILSYDLARGPDHDLTNWSSLTAATDDILITGVSATVTERDESGETVERTVLAGAEGYVLAVENPLIAGQEERALELMGQTLIGGSFRKFEGRHIAYPLAEFMDTVAVTDRKGNTYRSVITDMTFAFLGLTELSNSAQDAIRNSSRYISPETKAIIAARELAQAERTARQTAVEALEKRLAEAGGLYATAEVQPDGSTVYYLHDKPELADSQNVIKLTAEAIGFSEDGGVTWPFGFTVTGEMVMGIIRSEGLSADWVTVGSMSQDRVEGLAELGASLEVLQEKITTKVWKTDIEEAAAALLCIASTNGTVFKNDNVSTVLRVTIYRSGEQITDLAALRAAMGDTAELRWSFQRLGEETYYAVDPDDPRIGGDGFTFTLTPDDVDAKATFVCELIV